MRRLYAITLLVFFACSDDPSPEGAGDSGTGEAASPVDASIADASSGDAPSTSDAATVTGSCKPCFASDKLCCMEATRRCVDHASQCPVQVASCEGPADCINKGVCCANTNEAFCNPACAKGQTACGAGGESSCPANTTCTPKGPFKVCE